MHARLTLPLLLIAALSAPALRAQNEKPETYTFDVKPAIPAPLEKQFEALKDQSSWAQDTTYEGDKTDKSKRGVYPVGNGRVFTYMGLGQYANTMQALTGPQYQTSEAFAPKGMFGELNTTLQADGKSVTLGTQRTRRVRGANFVVTEDRNDDGLALRTLTFAQPDTTTLTRVYEVHNGTKAAVKGLSLLASVEGEGKVLNGTKLLLNYDRPERKFFAVLMLTDGQASGKGLQTGIPELAPGASWSGVLTITSGKGAGPKDGWTATPATLAKAEETAKVTKRWWDAKLADSLRVVTNHPHVQHLIEDWRILLLTQRCANSGVVTPMVNHRGAWPRQCNGPLLLMLRYNMWADAKQLLTFYHDAARATNQIRGHYPLDLDLAGIDNKETDWKKVTVEDSEVASWILIQHFWYYRATRDAKLVVKHKPFLLACLQKQKRYENEKMIFGKGDLHFQDLLKHVAKRDPKALPEDSMLVAHAPNAGRAAFSMARGALYLVALQGYGEMIDGIDKMNNPKKYEVSQTPMDRPGRPYLVRSFGVMENIEKTFFMGGPAPFVEGVERFSPAVSPVSLEPHTEPIANLNLIPMWLGWTFTSGEKSRDNFRYSLHRLMREGTRVGTTKNIDYFTGQIPGMVLTGLAERNGLERRQHFDYVMGLAAPAGEWGEMYSGEGRPVATNDAEWPNRLQPNESGINLDAMIYACTGIRHVAIPNFDDDSIKVKPRLHNKCNFMEFYNMKKDGRAINLYSKTPFTLLTKQEIIYQNSSPKWEQRDVNKKHKRFWFRIELLSKEPWSGYYQVDANVAGTMFVRNVTRKTNVQEFEFFKEDGDPFFRPGKGRPAYKPRVAKAPKVLLVSNRTAASEVFAQDSTTIVDSGLPFRIKDVRQMLLSEDGKPVHETLLFDIGYDDRRSGRTCKPDAFWHANAWQKLLADYRNAGGKIIWSQAIANWKLKDGKTATAKKGWLDLGEGNEPVTLTAVIQSDRARDVILRWGTGCGYVVKLNGNEVGSQAGARNAFADADESLISLDAGDNTLEITLSADGPQRAIVRITDGQGLPAQGVKF